MAVTQDRPDTGGADPAEGVATVLAAKREILLRVYRDRLPHEDLEDCLGQAALELVTRARADGLQGERHIVNALEQKFVSRIIDRQRSIARRGPTTALGGDAGGLDDGEATQFEIVAPDGEPSDTAASRDELERLREVAAELTEDQRLVLACQVSLGMDSAEFCERFGWSPERFRKVAQRARTRLRKLLTEYELGERCERLEADIVAYAAHSTSAAQSVTVREHLANCIGCAALVRDLRLASDRVGALLPLPALASGGLSLKLGVAAKTSALWRVISGPFAGTAPATATAGGGAGSGATAALAKGAIAAMCAASLAGGAHLAGPKHIDRDSRPRHARLARHVPSAAKEPKVEPAAIRRTPRPARASTRSVHESRAARARSSPRAPRHRTLAHQSRRRRSVPLLRPPSPARQSPLPPSGVDPPRPATPAPRSDSGSEFGVE